MQYLEGDLDEGGGDDEEEEEEEEAEAEEEDDDDESSSDEERGEMLLDAGQGRWAPVLMANADGEAVCIVN